MKHFTLFGLIIIFALNSFNSFSQTNLFPTSGNAGIGTISPNGKLHIVGTGDQDLLLQNAGIGFSSESADYGDLILARWEDYFLDLTNVGSGDAAIATALRISANHTLGKEATLALVRGSSGNLEFLDIYNNGYTNETQHGIRIQKRGTGEYRDFVIDQYDGSNLNTLFTLTSTGLAGIGTKTPSQKLDVAGNIGTSGSLFLMRKMTDLSTRRNWGFSTEVTNPGDFQLLVSEDNTSDPSNARVTVTRGGDVGIGTRNPLERLDVSGCIRVRSGNGIYFEDENQRIEQQEGYLNIQTSDGNNIILQPSGNVGIGIINPQNKLDVNGKIRANEIVVNTLGADFVFDTDYKLPTLYEVESFIKEHNHLPGIAPTSEMVQTGMNVSEMQTKLLQKVEEMTLYIIEQNKKNELQDREIDLMKQEISKLKKQSGQGIQVTTTSGQL